MPKHDDDFYEAMDNISHEGDAEVEPSEAVVFAEALRVLKAAGVPHMVGGAFAKHAYTGVWRHTKDLDVFLKPEDLEQAVTALQDADFETEVEFRHWLAKARKEPHFIDLIFGTGHGQVQIDDSWFHRSPVAEVLGVETHLLPLEAVIALTAYVAERSRFDGADVVHMIHQAEGNVDWQRVLTLLDENRELLLWHLILFDFVYPDKSHYLPQSLMVTLFEEMRARWSTPHKAKEFRGTLLDPFSFVVDVEDWGYEDRRDLSPQVDESGGVV